MGNSPLEGAAAQPNTPEVTKALNALGNPVRRHLLEFVAKGPAPVGTIAAAFDVSRPAISRHLKILENAQLVQHECIGREHYYELCPAGFEHVQDYLQILWREGLARFKVVAESLDRHD